MNTKDYTPVLNNLYALYEKHAPTSAVLQQRAAKVLVDGGSHSLRLMEPFPPRIKSAEGAYVLDEDGNRILDFWQGHYGNILGHNPPFIVQAVIEQLSEGHGLLSGFTEFSQVELAELITTQTGTDRVRFTTSGTLATMYAILLSKAFTNREFVMKVGGGWHGAHPWGLKGVAHSGGFKNIRSAGIPPQLNRDVIITKFNRPEKLKKDFKLYGDRLACFIVEPVIGAGGMMPATSEYLESARTLSEKYGVVLIFDEVVSGFRFRAGDVGALFGIKPDLITLGKIIGGGMPVAAVAGRKEIVDQVGRASKVKVKFSGGTYSGHPASMVAAKTMVAYLIEHEDEVYPRLTLLGRILRQSVQEVFSREGVLARFAGYQNEVIKDNSLNSLVFPYDDSYSLDCPDEVLDPKLCDIDLSEKVMKLALLIDDIHIVHGLGVLTTAHSEMDIAKLCEGYHKAIRLIKASY